MKGVTQRLREAVLSWPKPEKRKRRAACPFCDSLYESVSINEGEAARCRRCSHVIYQNRPASLARALCFSVSALILLVVAQCLPFLTLDAAGLQRQLTLANSSTALIRSGAPVLGGSVILFTMIAPLSLILGMIYVVLPLLTGHSAPLASHVVKWIYRTEPWNMVEVYLLGVLVSILKLAQVADVSINAGFASFAGVMICIAAALAAIDRRELWDRIELAKEES